MEKINQKPLQINTRAMPEYGRLSNDCPSFLKYYSLVEWVVRSKR